MVELVPFLEASDSENRIRKTMDCPHMIMTTDQHTKPVQHLSDEQLLNKVLALAAYNNGELILYQHDLLEHFYIL
jgi:hypothetical protein